MRGLNCGPFMRPRQNSLRGRAFRQRNARSTTTARTETRTSACDAARQSRVSSAPDVQPTCDSPRHGTDRCRCSTIFWQIETSLRARMSPSQLRLRHYRDVWIDPQWNVPNMRVYSPLPVSTSSIGQSRSSTHADYSLPLDEHFPFPDLQYLIEPDILGAVSDPSLDIIENNAVRERYLSGIHTDVEDLSESTTALASPHSADSPIRTRSNRHIAWSDEVRSASPATGLRRPGTPPNLAEAVSVFDTRDLDAQGQPVMPQEELPVYVKSSGLDSYYDATGMAHELDFAQFDNALRGTGSSGELRTR